MNTTERISNVVNQMSSNSITLQEKEEWGEARRQGKQRETGWGVDKCRQALQNGRKVGPGGYGPYEGPR